MGMSTYVLGFRPADEKYRQMKLIWDACDVADIQPPKEVTDFFNDEPPDGLGVQVDIGAATKDWRDEFSRQGLEVDIDKLPKDVTVIRFVNSW